VSLYRVRTGPGIPGDSLNFVFVAFQGWEVMEFCAELWKVMENLITIKKIMSRSLLCIMVDKNFTGCILLNYE